MCAKDGYKRLEIIQESKGPFVLFIPEFYMISGIVDSEKAKIMLLAEFITALNIDAGYQAAFTSIGKQSTQFNVGCD